MQILYYLISVMVSRKRQLDCWEYCWSYSSYCHYYRSIYNIQVCIFRPSQAKKCLRVCAQCADLHHPAHVQKTHPGICFPFKDSILVASNDFADSQGPDQTAWVRWLTWTFAFCIYPKTCFHMARPVLCIKK